MDVLGEYAWEYAHRPLFRTLPKNFTISAAPMSHHYRSPSSDAPLANSPPECIPPSIGNMVRLRALLVRQSAEIDLLADTVRFAEQWAHASGTRDQTDGRLSLV